MTTIDPMSVLAPGRTIRVIRRGKLRHFTIAVDGKTRPGLFSSERAALAAFAFTDSELAELKATKAGGAIGLADLAGLRASASGNDPPVRSDPHTL